MKRFGSTLTLGKQQVLLGGFELVRDLAMITKQLFVNSGPSIVALLENTSYVSKTLKIHDECYSFNPNLGDWGRGICFAEVNRTEVKYYLCRLVYKIDASAQAVGEHPHFTQPLRYCARSGRVRLWVRTNLGQICVIPSVDVGVEAAIATSALGAL